MTNTNHEPFNSSTWSSSPNPPVDHTQSVSYLISTSENHLEKACWEIKDTQDRLVFRSSKGLTQSEVVENIQDLSGESLWSIYRPIRGWYLALRSPKDTNSHHFIELEPSNASKGKNRMVEFTFRLKSSSLSGSAVDKSANGLQIYSSNINSTIKRRHPSISGTPQSPNQSTSMSPEREQPHQPLESLIVRLKLMDQHPKQTSIFKSFTDLFLNNNQRIECFIDSSILPNTPNHTNLSPSLGKNRTTENGSSEPSTTSNMNQKESSNRLVLFEYEDQNSVFGIQHNGLLRIHLKNTLKLQLLDDHDHLNDLDFHQAFWISVCIAYLGFRADQDAYIAAIQDD